MRPELFASGAGRCVEEGGGGAGVGGGRAWEGRGECLWCARKETRPCSVLCLIVACGSFKSVAAVA